MPRSIIAIGGFLTLIFVLFSATQVIASGVGFSPGRIDFDDNSKTEAATLYVINTGQEMSTYQVYAETNYEGWFNISPSEFSLNPNEHKPVTISLSPSDVPVGEHIAKLCVVAFAESKDARVGTGAKVPVHIAITSRIQEPATQPETLLLLPESTISTTEALTDNESTGPVQVDLWIGIATAIIVATITLVIVIRRRKRIEAQ